LCVGTMKHLTLIVMSLALTGCAELGMRADGEPESFRFLVAGQSNGVSYMQGTQGLLSSVTGRVVIHDLAGCNGVAMNCPSSLTWIYLGDMLAGTYRQSIIFHNISRGNTSTDQWIQNGWYKDIGRMAKQNNVTAVLWVQGESDALAGNIDTYANMKKMILDSRKQVPNLKWFVALNGFTSSWPRECQNRLISEGLAYRGVDVDTLRQTYGVQWFTSGNYAEFSNIDGLKGHAQEWFTVLEQNRRWAVN
jgi:hypothetical protein